MNIIEIDDLKDSRLECFASLSDAQLQSRLDPQRALMIVESPKVISSALEEGYQPVALLCERRHISGDASNIIESIDPNVPIFTGSRKLLETLTGYTLTRGVLCAMKRPAPLPISEILRNAHRVMAIQGVCDTTNIGAIFRSVAALGFDAVILSEDSCSPFNRRAIRVSMGTVFKIPWTWSSDLLSDFKAYGFKTVAMALRNDSVDITDSKLKNEEKLAVIMGTEGDGLPEHFINEADFTVKIPMMHGVDSLNVAAASAIACWELSKKTSQFYPP